MMFRMMRLRMMMLRMLMVRMMMFSRMRMSMVMRKMKWRVEGDDVEEMHFNISQEPLYTENYRKNAAPQIETSTRTHTHTLAQKYLIELLMWSASHVQKHLI